MHILPTDRHTKEARERIERLIAEGQITYVDLQFTDVTGTVKAVTIPASQFGDAMTHGTWFDGSSLDSRARLAESDMYLAPDLTTFEALPWSDGSTARAICSAHTPDGAAVWGDPRRALQQAAARAADLGYAYHVGPEVEFYLLTRADDGTVHPLPHDTGGYFDFSTDKSAIVRRHMVAALGAMGIDVNTVHHEISPGQHEIDLGRAPVVHAADATVTLRYVLNAVAQQHNVIASFMPKPFAGHSGSGLHVHQSLVSSDSGKNAFTDQKQDYGLSDIARHFIAGQLHHAAAMSAVLAPTVNSYKRLGRGFEAPVFVSWARTNRGALIRVPHVGRPEATRVELRSPDPSCNPYLAYAVMLRCGLDGIERSLPLPAAVEESLWGFDDIELQRRNVGVLPESLRDALDAFERDNVVRDALGDQLAERFLESKTLEWNEYRTQVTSWELETYLERA